MRLNLTGNWGLALPILLAAQIGAFAQSLTFTPYGPPGGLCCSINYIATGPDGALWFTDSIGNMIWRITTIGIFSAFPAGGPPGGITAGPDGALWFTSQSGYIGRITTSGTLTKYPAPNLTPLGGPYGITAGPDGALWFAESYNSAKIGRITTSGSITEFSLPASLNAPGQIVNGPDGALWFASPYGASIGRITTSGSVTGYYPPAALLGLGGLTVGPDGALWFTENMGWIGRITTAGNITEYPVPVPANSPGPGFGFPNYAALGGITAGPDGNLWFTLWTTSGLGQLGRVTTAGTITEFPITTPVPDFFSKSYGITTGPDGTLWFIDETTVWRAQIGAGTPPPTISQITPNPINAGSPATTLRILGTGLQNSTSGCYNPTPTVSWNSTSLPVLSVTSTEVDVTVPASLLASPTTATVTVAIPYYYAGTCPSQSAQATVQVVNSTPAGGSLGISPASLSFAASPGNLPPPQPISVTSNGSPLSFGVSIQLTSSAPVTWLSASPSNAITPATVNVSINSSALTLPAGKYTANVIFTATTGSTMTASITAQITTANDIKIIQTAMVFGALLNAPAPPSQILAVQTLAAGTVQFSTNVTYQKLPPAPWLQVPTGTTAPTNLNIIVNPAGLPPGAYTAYLNLSAAGNYQVPVFLVVEASAQDGVAFSYQLGGAAPPSQSYPTINSNSGSGLAVTIGASSDLGWLQFATDSYTTPVNLTISASVGPIVAAGTYYGIVVLTDLENSDPQQDVYIILATINVSAASSPVISSITPSALIAGPSAQSFTINGSAFLPGLGVSLTPPGGAAAVLSSSQVSYSTSTSVAVSAVLPVAGSYRIFVTNVDGGVSNIYPFQVSGPVTQTISHIADGDGWSTSIILVNTGAQPASFTLQFTGDNGTAFAPSLTGLGRLSNVTGTIPVGGSKTISTDGTSPQLTEGWARVTSSQSIDGTAIFRSAPKGLAVQEAAVPLLPSGSSSLLFPFDNNTNLVTGVALAAPDNNTYTTVSWRQRNQFGQNLTASPEPPESLPPFGHTALVLPAHSQQAADLRGVAQFDSQYGFIFGLGIRFNKGAFTSIEAVTQQQPATKIISHIADGGSWKTTIILVNTDTVPASFQVNLWQDNGNPFPVQLVGATTQASISGIIAVGGSYTIETADAARNLSTGWAEVLSSQSIGGTAVFRSEGSGQEAAVPLLTTGGTKLMLPFDSGSGLVLGVALANPSLTQDAAITYTLRDENGNPIPNNPPGSISLPRHQHASLVLPVTLNGVAEQRGVVEFDSPNAAIFALGIRFNNGAFTSMRALGK